MARSTEGYATKESKKHKDQSCSSDDAEVDSNDMRMLDMGPHEAVSQVTFQTKTTSKQEKTRYKCKIQYQSKIH